MVRGKYKYKKHIKKCFSLIILSCIMAVTMNNAAMAVVIDVSGHDGLIDWDSAKEHIEGVIIRLDMVMIMHIRMISRLYKTWMNVKGLVFHMEYIYIVMQ